MSNRGRLIEQDAHDPCSNTSTQPNTKNNNQQQQKTRGKHVHEWKGTED